MRNSITAYELGAETPTYAKLIRLAEELNVSTDYLLGYEMDDQLDLSGLSEKNRETVIKLVKTFKRESMDDGRE